MILRIIYPVGHQSTVAYTHPAAITPRTSTHTGQGRLSHSSARILRRCILSPLLQMNGCSRQKDAMLWTEEPWVLIAVWHLGITPQQCITAMATLISRVWHHAGAPTLLKQARTVCTPIETPDL